MANIQGQSSFKNKKSLLLRFLSLALIGFANALPLTLTGPTLSIWLTETGFQKGTIGLLALLGIPFSLRILWTPIIDHLPLFPGKQRKTWLLLSLICISLALFGLSFIQPGKEPWKLITLLFVIPLFTGCLYIVGIAYELESIEEEKYGLGSASVLTGYRIGLLCGGGGALYLSSIVDWSWMFRIMSGFLCLGSFLFLLQPEPFQSHTLLKEKRQRLSQYGSLFKGFWNEIILQPYRSFIRRSDGMLVLLLLFTFKVGDQLVKSMEGPFYLSLGFDKTDIAIASKLCGMTTTIIGAFLGGLFVRGKDPAFSLIVIGSLHACTLWCYTLLITLGNSLGVLCCIVALQNFTGGMAMTVFIFFLWRICDKNYAAVQYALLWSLFTLKGDLLSCLGGLLAMHFSWQAFFSAIAVTGITTSLLASHYLLKSREVETQT